MLARALALLRRFDDAAEVAMFDLAPRLARRAGLPLAFLTLGLLTAGIYQNSAEPPSPDVAPAAELAASDGVSPDASVYLLDRIWIDKPGAKLDQQYALWFFSDHPMGDRGLWSAYQSGFPAKATYELFVARPSERAIAVTSVHDRHQARFEYSIAREKRGKFDLKLTIKNDPHHGGKAHVYWSRMDKWRGRDDGPTFALAPPR